jgi:hypothetical protein
LNGEFDHKEEEGGFVHGKMDSIQVSDNICIQDKMCDVISVKDLTDTYHNLYVDS